MKTAAWMVIGSLASALLAIAIAGRRTGREILLGMVAPLAAAAVSWVLTERTFRQNPERLTALLMSGFVAKMAFFGAYVVVMLAVVGLGPVPFVASFTSYFIGLYVFEALLMRRLFAPKSALRN
jgi:hypothetical protein